MPTLQERFQILIAPQVKKPGFSWGNNSADSLSDQKSNLTSEVVNLILDEAVKARASDIHFEPVTGTYRIRYRIDGRLHVVLTTENDLGLAILRRVKVMSGLTTDGMSAQSAQDARFKAKVQGQDRDFRVATFPTILGEKIVLRILSEQSESCDIAQIGMEHDDQQRLRRLLRLRNGLFLVCGPTGSGKTTTLYSMLKEMNSPLINIITLEDPVEYQIQGMNQCDIKTRSKFNFADGLKAVLRQDPDIILVGEIRDGETAEIATRAAITGHFVLSSVHANSAFGTLVRLLNMGLNAYTVSYALRGIIAQRLVRKVCDHCNVPYVPNAAEVSAFRSRYGEDVMRLLKKESVAAEAGVVTISYSDEAPSGEYIFARGRGCAHCNGTGFCGRLGIFEFVVFTEELREAVLAGKTSTQLQEIAVNSGMRTLRMDAVLKIKKGLTTIDECGAILVE